MGIICSNISRQNSCICYKEKRKDKNSSQKKINEKIKNKVLLSPEQKDQLKKFLEEKDYQRDFYNNTDDNDTSFNNLKEKEEKQLIEEFDKIKANYSQNLNDNIKNIFQNDNKNNKLILDIIKNENTENIYKFKIIDQINAIKEKESEYKIDHLTILLIGRESVGKTTLIKYILNFESDNEKDIIKTSDENYTIYQKKGHHLKLIEFKSFGLSERPEKIREKTVEYIKKLINSKKTDYNDFVHCIWFCISGTRIEESEAEIIKNLTKVYKDNTMPIIFIYLQAIDKETADNMGNFVKKTYKNSTFIEALAKDMDEKKAFGNEEILKQTMKRCTKALQGEMIKLMTQKISKEVEKIMEKNNENNRLKINQSIINEFTGKYKIVKSDNDFIEHIINILKNNLLKFYENYKENISNNTLTLLNKSELVNEVKKYIKIYKDELKKKIECEIEIQVDKFFDKKKVKESIVERKAKDFICIQADIEKKNDNINIDHKRRIEGFKKTNRKFFEQNYYFICQKYLINEIIQNYITKFFVEISNKIDEIINDLLDKKGKDIQNNLEDCFKKKLKNFAIKADIPFEEIITSDTKTIGETPGEFDNEIHEIKPDIEGYTPNNAPSKNQEKESYYLEDEELEIKDNLNNSLIEFFQKNIIQDSNFNQETQDDEVFNLLIFFL